MQAENWVGSAVVGDGMPGEGRGRAAARPAVYPGAEQATTLPRLPPQPSPHLQGGAGGVWCRVRDSSGHAGLADEANLLPKLA